MKIRIIFVLLVATSLCAMENNLSKSSDSLDFTADNAKAFFDSLIPSDSKERLPLLSNTQLDTTPESSEYGSIDNESIQLSSSEKNESEEDKFKSIIELFEKAQLRHNEIEYTLANHTSLVTMYISRLEKVEKCCDLLLKEIKKPKKNTNNNLSHSL